MQLLPPFSVAPSVFGVCHVVREPTLQEPRKGPCLRTQLEVAAPVGISAVLASEG